MVMSMRIKVNVANLPAPPYKVPEYRYPKPVECPEDATIIKLDIKSRPLVQPIPWCGRNRKDLWSEEHDKLVFQMWQDGKDLEEIAKAVRRKVDAVYQRLWRLCKEKGVSRVPIRGKCIRYTPEQDALIMQLHNDGVSEIDIAKRLGRSYSGIIHKIRRLEKRAREG